MAHTPDREIGTLELVRHKVAVRVSRLLRWEFWPACAIYLPLVPHILLLAAKHRGLTTCCLANPGIPLGGLVGESKYDILRMLPRCAIVPTALIPPGPVNRRLDALETTLREGGWTWPVILKPDVGERGTGVRRITDIHAAREYLAEHVEAVIAQAYDLGPYEAGVFYVRMPGDTRGCIFSITDKRFAQITGDGRSSLHALIWRHPRYRLQATVFLDSLGEESGRVPAEGETVSLGWLGNHCRGSLFLDGAGLITPELTREIDAIARQTPGFLFGRFDVRYSSIDEFKAGQHIRIVELNGVLSESTSIYDPCTSFWGAQAVLRKQWTWAYRIGDAVSRAGAERPSLRSVLEVCMRHLRKPRGARGERVSQEAAAGLCG